MIAEIKGKISSTGSNLSDRLEDNLTGNVFGTLRYMSFQKGLKKILLEGISSKNSKAMDIIKNINVEEWSKNISFWPYDEEGEIDVLLEFDNCVIGIEVKYLSGISSDDDIINNVDESRNQLSRESRIVSKKAHDKEKILIFIADQLSCVDVYKDVSKRNIIKDDVNLVYISWQKILDILQHLNIDNEYEKLMIKDLIDLLVKKGFNQFENFLIEEPVINENYFKFGNVKKVMKKENIDFLQDENIRGDLYYEF